MVFELTLKVCQNDIYIFHGPVILSYLEDYMKCEHDCLG